MVGKLNMDEFGMALPKSGFHSTNLDPTRLPAVLPGSSRCGKWPGRCITPGFGYGGSLRQSTAYCGVVMRPTMAGFPVTVWWLLLHPWIRAGGQERYRLCLVLNVICGYDDLDSAAWRRGA